MKILFLSTKHKVKKLTYIFFIIVIISISLLFISDNAILTSVSKDQLTQDLLQMFHLRDTASLEGDVETVKSLFDTNRKIGLWAYEHEKKRTTYLKNWSLLRDTKFIAMESDVAIQRIRPKGDSIWIDFLHSGKFTYEYNDMPGKPTSFGIGTRRAIELVKKDDKWIIRREWYLDPFEDVLEIPEELKNKENTKQPSIIVDTEVFNEIQSVEVSKTSKRYDRDKAVEYADKYSGATFGSTNGYRYNKKYRDYTFLGGDCANFGSQILVNGGLKMDRTWFYSFKFKGIGGGTRPWLKAANLRNYLLYSGKSKLIMRGTLEQVMKPSSKHPNGAYTRLKKGDIICYDHSKSSHISIVTGFDPKGLPLVNSHSTDRYRVPWDMGWTSKKIKYWLIQIRE